MVKGDKAIRLEDCDIKIFTPGCLGGRKFCITDKSGSSVSYIVKLGTEETAQDSHFQSVNEYVAQCLLKSLGFSAIPVCWVDRGKEYIKRERYYGATQYMDGLTRITPDSEMAPEVLPEYVRLTLLNALLNNCDGGEIYLDSSGKICSLDYGETFMSSLLFNWIMSGIRYPSLQKSDKYKENTEHLRNAFIESSDDFYHLQFKKLCGVYGDQLVREASTDVLNRVAGLETETMSDCFQSLERHTHSLISDLYREQILHIKALAARLGHEPL